MSSKQNNQIMLRLFFYLGIFVGSLINLANTPEADELKKDEEKVATINTKE